MIIGPSFCKPPEARLGNVSSPDVLSNFWDTGAAEIHITGRQQTDDALGNWYQVRCTRNWSDGAPACRSRDTHWTFSKTRCYRFHKSAASVKERYGRCIAQCPRSGGWLRRHSGAV